MKKRNAYQEMVSDDLFDRTPKAVWASLAISFLFNHQGLANEHLENGILEEWQCLFENGIVPQKPRLKRS